MKLNFNFKGGAGGIRDQDKVACLNQSLFSSIQGFLIFSIMLCE